MIKVDKYKDIMTKSQEDFWAIELGIGNWELGVGNILS